MIDALRNTYPSRWSNVTPFYDVDSVAEPGNATPALARLLIDRVREDLTSRQRQCTLNVSEEIPQWALN